MARARKSHIGDEEKAKPRSRIEPPYAKDNPYVVYCDLKREGEDHARVLILNFSAKYAAHYFIMKLIRSDTWEVCKPLINRTGIITASNIRITMFDGKLQELIDYEPTEAEAEWKDERVDQQILAFKYGRSEEAKEVVIETDGDDSSPSPKSIKPAKPAKPPREPKPVKVKPDTSGHVSANDIAKKLGVEGREVRGVLRALSLPKPEHGWSWPKAEADKIEKQVVDHLKKGKKK